MELSRTSLIVLIAVVAAVSAGDEYSTRIPDDIAMCYFRPELSNRFNRMPMSLDNLISLIKKIEAHPSTELWDVSKMAGTILRRFRYDGIVDAPNPEPGLLPVQRNVVETDKHRLTWDLIPGHESDFPEDSLTDIEKCALHWMISYSTNHTMRAEEARRRSLDGGEVIPWKEDNSGSEDEQPEAKQEAEPAEEHEAHHSHEEAAPEDAVPSDDLNDTGFHPDDNEESHDNHDEDHFRRRRETLHAATPHSAHPIERGVVRTQWGTVAIGNVLSGIAAGLQPETVQLRDLGMVIDGSNTVSEGSLNRTIESPWVVTLAGEMAQTALLRASKYGLSVVGPRGSWNSSTCPKEYYLNVDDPSLMTTAEIYGGIDGLAIATRIQSWNSDFMKLSSILEMYYSKNGVYPERQYRACNRINIFKEKINAAKLKEQALNSALVYYAKGSADVPQAGPGVRPVDMIGGLINKTFNSLNSYLNDKEQTKLDFEECYGEPILTEPTSASLVDVTFVVDQSTDDSDISKQKNLIAALVNALDIRPGGSRLEVVSSKDASAFIEFQTAPNKASLACSIPNTLIAKGERRIADVLGKLRSRILSERSKEKQNRVGGSSGRVVIFFVSSYTANTAEKDKIKAELARMTKETPDVRLMFVTASNPEEFSQIVEEPTKDIIRLNNYVSYEAAAPDIAQRLTSLPARIVYPACSSLSEAASEKFYNFTGFTKIDNIQYFKIDPYQFFSSVALTLKFQVNYGIATVCVSRTKRQPGSSDTCKTSTVAGETLDIKITQPCARVAGPESCQPIYVSLKNSINDNTPCSERGCQTPQDVKYVISHEGMRCNSAAAKLISHLLLALAVVSCFWSKRQAL